MRMYQEYLGWFEILIEHISHDSSMYPPAMKIYRFGTSELWENPIPTSALSSCSLLK